MVLSHPARISSITVLVLVSAIFGERENIADYVREIGVVVTLFRRGLTHHVNAVRRWPARAPTPQPRRPCGRPYAPRW